MRVVAGKYRGKTLKSPSDDKIRPTTTRIKETLFNVLQGYVKDSVALDLFAGSGALGIECISRGAREVSFVDKSRDAINLVKQNLNGINENYRIYNTDFLAFLHSCVTQGKKFDLIFIDPPYASGIAEIAVEFILQNNLLEEDGIIIFEHGEDKTYTLDNKGYKQRTKKMGTVVAEFISKKRVALMAGSFDPFTRGHEAVLDESLCEFDEVYVACLINLDKTYRFNDAQRLRIAEEVCKTKKGAHAIFSRGFAVDVAKEVGAEILIRGVRDDDDLQYEKNMADYNREHGYDTKFIYLDAFKEVSSTVVREQIEMGDYKNLPACVVPLIQSTEFLSLQ